MNHSRVLPLPTYRDPNYASDSSFENYYLNYEEEKKSNVSHDIYRSARPTSKRRKIEDQIHRPEINNKLFSPSKIRLKKRATTRRKKCDNFNSGTRTDNSSDAQRTVMGNYPTVEDDDRHDPAVRGGVEPPVAVGSSVLFIRRVLQNSDINMQQHRLSLPCKQVKILADNLFTRDESMRLRNRSPVEAKLIDPRGEEYGIKLRLTMAGPSTYCYAIGKPWLRIKDENGFEPGMVLDVRVTRRGEMGELCFILERVS